MKTETYEIIIETLSSALSLEKWRREEAEARVRELKEELAQKEKKNEIFSITCKHSNIARKSTGRDKESH